MARASRRHQSRANAEHHQNADPNDGPDDGRWGGADQITEPDCDAVEAKVLTRLHPGRQLAERKRVGDEPHAVLDAMGGAVAESLGRRDAPPLILESRAAATNPGPRGVGNETRSRYADNDFAKMRARGHVPVGRPRLIEGEYLINYRLNAARRYRTAHRLKHLHRADGDALHVGATGKD